MVAFLPPPPNPVRLIELTSDPMTLPDRGFLYTKDVGGNTELFYIDPDPGVAVQLTSGGSVNAREVIENLPVLANGQDTFTLSQTPADPAEVKLFLNGLIALQPSEFTVSGQTVSWLGIALKTTDVLTADYRV